MAETVLPSPRLRVMVLDDEATIRTTLSLCLETAGHRVEAFGTGREALEASEKQVFDLLFLDLRLGTENGLDFIPQFSRQSPWMKIIVITAYASIDTAVEAMRRGAIDYLPKPFTPEHVEMLAGKVAQGRAAEFRMRELLELMDSSVPPVALSSENRRVQTATEIAKTLAASKSIVLIQGEDGTGKRTLARLMHEQSPRRHAPYMMWSARGNGEGAAATELFGGGAGVGGRSRLEHCAGGTLYLDDVAALSDRLQLALLDFAQSGTFEREGTFERVAVDVRIIAGAGAPLEALMKAGVFREDLFYALSAKTVELPPLRERTEDFEKLVEGFLAFYGRQHGRTVSELTGEAMDYLRGYRWPGNLRELRNVIERAVLLAPVGGTGGGAAAGRIGIEHLPPNLQTRDSAARLGDLVALEAIEELHIRGVLAATQSLETAAKILGIDYATLWRRRKKYGL